MKKSISVQNTFDNCFFHAFAAYLLSNNLPFPENLFSIDQNEQISSNNKAAEQLKNLFSSPEDLEIFDQYQILVNPNKKSNHLVEKTLILAVLLREWFARQLFANKNHQNYLFDNKNENDVSFIKLTVHLQTALTEEDKIQVLELMRTDDRAWAIYSANEAFFNNLHEETFEDLKNYWQQEGYKNYCQHLANLGVKIAYTDVAPVLKDLNLTYTIYDKTSANIITANQGNSELPPFEAMIHSPGEHYYLLKPADPNQMLEEYEESLAQYRQDNEKISAIGIAELAQSQTLSMDEIEHRKKEICSQSTCLLLDAICSAGANVISTFNSMIDLINIMKQEVLSFGEISNNASPAQPGEDSMQEMFSSFEELTSDENDNLMTGFTEHEKCVIDTTVSTQLDPQKAKQYKVNLIELFKYAKENSFFSNNKNKHEIAHSPNLVGEYDLNRDEKLAKSLQEEEFKRVKLL